MRQQGLAVAVAGRPRRDAVGDRRRASRWRSTTRVVAVSMAQDRRPAAVVGSRGRLEVAPVASAPGDERDRPRVVAGPVDADVEARRRAARRPSRSGHSTSVTPVAWRSSMRPPASASVGVGQAVRVDVEQRQAALVLGHEHEARRGDRVGHARGRPRRPWRGGSCRPRGRPTGRSGRRPARRPTERRAEARRGVGIRG